MTPILGHRLRQKRIYVSPLGIGLVQARLAVLWISAQENGEHVMCNLKNALGSGEGGIRRCLMGREVISVGLCGGDVVCRYELLCVMDERCTGWWITGGSQSAVREEVVIPTST